MRALGPGSVSSFLKIILDVVFAALWIGVVAVSLITLAALLLSLSDAPQGARDIIQGVEMGRPSRLRAGARRTADGVRATIGGGCVPVLSGHASV